MKKVTLSIATALQLALFGSPLQADQSSATSPSSLTNVQLDIPSQPIDDALNTFAEQSGVQVVLYADHGKGIQSAAVNGTFDSNNDALSTMLAETNLEYKYINERTIAVQAVAPNTSKNTSTGKTLPVPEATLIAQAGTPATKTLSAPSQIQPGAEEFRDDELPEIIPEEVRVTGSNIRGHQNPSAQVFQIDSQDMLMQGLSTTEDVFRSITQVFGRGTSAAMDVNENVPSGSVGHSSVDIGGFGSKSTLVLINGRRTANSSIMYGDSVNISTIPITAIDRVEVLPAGAAAIYGADAVGGVVNIMLKKDAEFASNTSFRVEDSSYGGDSYQISQDISFGWSGGRFTGVASFQHTDPVTSKALGFTTQDFRSRGGHDLRSMSFGQTGIISGFGSLPPNNNGTQFGPNDVSYDNVEPASNIVEYLTPEISTTSIYANAEQDIGARTTLFLDVLYSKNNTDNYEVPHNVFGAEVPASNGLNSYGDSVFVNYQFDTERNAGQMPSVYREADQELTQFTFGVEFQLPKDWRMQLYATDADEKSLHTFSWVANWADPAVFAALADSNPDSALNLFGDGTAQNPETLQNIVGLWQDQRHNVIRSGMTAYAIQADGDLFSIPSGVVKASFGAEKREDSFDWAGFGANQPKGTRTADSLAAEFAIPLINGDSNSMAEHSLNLTVAARWDRYNAEGDFDYDGTKDHMDEFSDTSPMVGIAWEPGNNTRFRASWNESFRAPVVHDIAGLPFPYVTEVFDPLAPDDPSTPDVEGARLVQVDVSYPPSRDIGPENAEIWTVGMDLIVDNNADGGFKGSITYSNTNFTNRISGVYTYFAQDPSFVVSRPDIFPDTAQRDAAGNLTDVFLRNINIAGLKSEVWDLGMEYGWATNSGSFITLGIDSTYTVKFEEQIHAAAEAKELQGTFSGPDTLRAVLRGSWISASQNLSANVYVRTSTGYDNVIPAFAINNPEPGIGDEIVAKVDGYTSVDISGAYQFNGDSIWTSGVMVTGGVRNVFDADFPFIEITSGRVLPFDPRRVDPRGRVAYIEVRKLFD